MNKSTRVTLAKALVVLGIDPFHIRLKLASIRTCVCDYRWFRERYRLFWSDYDKLVAQYESSRQEFPLTAFSPTLDDRFAASGTARGHYFQQDLLVAQWIYQDKPARHVDIGSRIDGFVAHVASFREIEVLDIRPQESSVRNVRFKQADLMSNDPALSDSCESLSCLHTLEHFGLGRYGDPVDYYGYLSGWKNLHRLVKSGGRFYFSTPMGPQRIEFNSQRVFAVTHLKEMIGDLYEIERFAYVNDAGALVENADLNSPKAADNFGCQLGCAIFCLRKR